MRSTTNVIHLWAVVIEQKDNGHIISEFMVEGENAFQARWAVPAAWRHNKHLNVHLSPLLRLEGGFQPLERN